MNFIGLKLLGLVCHRDYQWLFLRFGVQPDYRPTPSPCQELPGGELRTGEPKQFPLLGGVRGGSVGFASLIRCRAKTLLY